jgi:hypothetical protein
MKVKELIEWLQRGNPDDEAVIAIDNHNNRFGSSPCVAVTNVYFGFDWDTGKTYLKSDNQLTVTNKKDDYIEKTNNK